ncbi:MAG TPA: putative zinc-binding protein [Phycisphaerae bacterium]|nr:putative zinc-binding protein [Phycisphaerae bacterium]
MKDRKVAVLPCTGVGQVVGTIARQAAYRACDDMRPDATMLVCLPALVKGVQEDIDMIRDYPVIVIEGCEELCATHALSTQGGSPAATVSIPDIMKGKGLRIRREARSRLTDSEQAVVELVADRVAAEIDRLGSG